MCRCCQRCWEDFYWHFIEEKFCYDESIANYNPEEDEYFTKKTDNGFIDSSVISDKSPVCSQPRGIINRTTSHISSKIHEDDYRQIQTNCAFLAPEILSVFANSQIFHDHPANKKSPTYPSVHGKSKATISETLLTQLEGQLPPNDINVPIKKQLRNSDEDSVNVNNAQHELEYNSIDSKNEVILRPHFEKVSSSSSLRTPFMEKRLKNVPYFSIRPASENDIFAISGSITQISMTPEVPSISYSTLPKHYEDTPTIEKYKETISLQSIQTTNSARLAGFDYTMPRYYRKSDIVTQSSESISPKMSPKKTVISKRLKMIRNTLPPLSIHMTKEQSKDKRID